MKIYELVQSSKFDMSGYYYHKSYYFKRGDTVKRTKRLIKAQNPKFTGTIQFKRLSKSFPKKWQFEHTFEGSETPDVYTINQIHIHGKPKIKS